MSGSPPGVQVNPTGEATMSKIARPAAPTRGPLLRRGPGGRRGGLLAAVRDLGGQAVVTAQDPSPGAGLPAHRRGPGGPGAGRRWGNQRRAQGTAGLRGHLVALRHGSSSSRPRGAPDASFVRHQGRNGDDFRQAHDRTSRGAAGTRPPPGRPGRSGGDGPPGALAVLYDAARFRERGRALLEWAPPLGTAIA